MVPPSISPDHTLPVGTITFFLTDVEESTKLWEQHPEAMRQALLRHEILMSRLIEQHHGRLVKTRGEGDSLFAVFSLAKNALTCACAVQQAFREEAWPAETPLRVRIALHTGEAAPSDTDYHGSAVNRCARLRSLAKGGETLLSLSTEQLVRDVLPGGLHLRDIGEQRLRGFSRPERVFRLVRSGDYRGQSWTAPKMRRKSVTLLLVLGVCLCLSLAGRLLWLRKPPAASTADRKIVAVLPFDVISSAESQDAYFADGLTEEMTNSLGNIRGLTVIGRISAAHIKDTLATNGGVVAQELHVGTLIRGKVSKEPGKLRVYVEADDAQGRQRLWAARYDKPYRVDDVLEIESDVAQSVARALSIRLTAGEQGQIARKYTDNDAAYDFYLQGRYFWNQRTEEGLKRAIVLFGKATSLDSHYAPAYVGESDAYDVLGYYGYINSDEAYQKAQGAAQRALTEGVGDDGTRAAAYASLAFAEMVYRHDWGSAEAGFKQATQLSPEYATAHQWYSLYLMLQNRIPDSINEINDALKKDPLSFIIGTSLGGRYYYAGADDRAVQQYDQVLDLNPDYTIAYFWRGLALEREKRYPAAASDFAAAVQRSHRSPLFLAFLGKDYAMAGRRDRAIAIRDELRARARRETVSPFCLAVVEVGLGENDKALALMEHAYDVHDGTLIFLQEAAPAFQSLRSDPRFEALRKKMGLPASYEDHP